MPISLATALTGGSAHVETLDGRRLTVEVGPGVVAPGTVKTVRGEGMPVSKSTRGEKGDLRVRLDVAFPTTLSDSQKAQLRAALRS